MPDAHSPGRPARAARVSFPGFDGIRLLAAWSVVFTHSYFLASGSGTLDPLHRLIGGTHGFGDYAVQVFFILSGLLLSGSLDTGVDPIRYLANRLFRIVPGFAFATVVSVLLIAPFLSDLGWRVVLTEQAWSSIYWSVGSLRDMSALHLPLARHADFEWFMNGSLWSITYEVVCYLVLLALYLLLRRDAAVAGAAVVLGGLALAGPVLGVATTNWDAAGPGVLRLPLACFDRTLPYFCGGVAYHAVHKRWGTPGWLALAAAVACVAMVAIGVPQIALAITGPILLAWLGLRRGPLARFTDRAGDLSYGVYLFGWPVGLLVSAYVRSAGPVAVFALSTPVTFALAYAMHHLVERPVANVAKPAVLRWLPRLAVDGRAHAAAPRWLHLAVSAVCLVVVVRFVLYPYPGSLNWFGFQWVTLAATCLGLSAVLAAGEWWARAFGR